MDSRSLARLLEEVDVGGLQEKVSNHYISMYDQRVFLYFYANKLFMLLVFYNSIYDFLKF